MGLVSLEFARPSPYIPGERSAVKSNAKMLRTPAAGFDTALRGDLSPVHGRAVKTEGVPPYLRRQTYGRGRTREGTAQAEPEVESGALMDP